MAERVDAGETLRPRDEIGPPGHPPPVASPFPERGVEPSGPASAPARGRILPPDLAAARRGRLRDFAASDNPMVNESAPLLAVLVTIDRLGPPEDAGAFRAELSREIVDLKNRLVLRDVLPSVAEKLCLLHAIALDELILRQPWAEGRGWEARTLVAGLFGMRDGGEKFFVVVERALLQPRLLRDFLQVALILLKIGFRGRYGQEREEDRRRVIDRITRALAHVGPEPGKPPAAPGRPPLVSKPDRQPPPAMLRAAVAAILAVALLTGAELYSGASRIWTAGAVDITGGSGGETVRYVYRSDTNTTERRVVD